MKLHSQRHINTKKIVTISILTVMLFAVVGFFIYTAMAQSKGVRPRTEAYSFTFDAPQAPGWRAGESNAQEDTNGVLQRTVRQGSVEASGGCYVMFFYYDQQLDSNSALQSAIDRVEYGGEAPSLKLLGSKHLSMSVLSNDTPFLLYQYKIIDTNSAGTDAAVEFAFIPVATGYVEARGYCEDSSALEDTFPVFEAVRLDS